MRPARVSVLVEQLVPLLSGAPAGLRLPALETIFARADLRRCELSDPDQLRYSLFGMDSPKTLPVGALTFLADQGGKSPGSNYCLRIDPVTLRADMARVIMTHYGFADLDEAERNGIENTVRAVLLDEGMDFGSTHPERWTIALEHPLDFTFSPLRKTLGMDVAEALPEDPQALRWRRILNEIQMALHECPVNVRRRREGRQEINSVWFWGGGYLPVASAKPSYQMVYSDHPVTRGLALVHECELSSPDEVEHSGCLADDFTESDRILVEWTPQADDLVTALAQLESFSSNLLRSAKRGGFTLDVYAANGTCWTWDRRSARRFWRRRIPPTLTLRRQVPSAD